MNTRAIDLKIQLVYQDVAIVRFYAKVFGVRVGFLPKAPSAAENLDLVRALAEADSKGVEVHKAALEVLKAAAAALPQSAAAQS